MLKLNITAIIAAAAISAPALAAPPASLQNHQESQAYGGQGNAKGTPERNADIPYGHLFENLKAAAGRAIAQAASAGSNSRWQDGPVSP